MIKNMQESAKDFHSPTISPDRCFHYHLSGWHTPTGHLPFQSHGNSPTLYSYLGIEIIFLNNPFYIFAEINYRGLKIS
jgi:hypothetical protein